jgi:hypothetical protein
MKKMLLAAVALAVMASPTLAQSGRTMTHGYGQSASIAWQTAPFRGGAPVGIYAQSPGAFQGYGVYRNGQYIGWDPDPSVRLMLLKDAGSENN